MGIDLWREFIKPRVRQMCELAKSKGKYVMIHCCGKVDELFGDLIECGLDIFNPFQPEVMDVFEMKRRYGEHLCFYGGISTQRTLPYGTVDQVKGEVKRLIDVVGENGGYIVSPAHDIPADAKSENIAAMIEVVQERQRQKPAHSPRFCLPCMQQPGRNQPIFCQESPSRLFGCTACPWRQSWAIAPGSCTLHAARSIPR